MADWRNHVRLTVVTASPQTPQRSGICQPARPFRRHHCPAHDGVPPYHSAPVADLQPPHKRCCSLHASACKPLPPIAIECRTPESSIQLGLPGPYPGYATAPAGVVLSGVLPKRCSDSSPPPRFSFVSASASAATLSACCSSRRAAKPPSRSLATRPGSACNTVSREDWNFKACGRMRLRVLQLAQGREAVLAQLGDPPGQRLHGHHYICQAESCRPECCSSRGAARPPSRSLATRPGSVCNTGAKEGSWNSFGVQFQACCSDFQSVLQLVERGEAAFAQLGETFTDSRPRRASTQLWAQMGSTMPLFRAQWLQC